MLDRVQQSVGAAEHPYRRATGRKWEPAIVLLLVALFAGSALICAALIGSVLWGVVTENPLRPGFNFRQCGALKDETERLACFDGVFQKMAAQYAKGVQQLTIDEIRALQRNAPTRNDY